MAQPGIKVEKRMASIKVIHHIEVEEPNNIGFIFRATGNLNFET